MNLRIVTYNIHYGGAGHANSIIEGLKATDAHIILLVEATDDTVTQSIAQGLGMRCFSVKGRKAHLALLSRLPISPVSDARSPRFERPLLQVKVDVGGPSPLTMYGMHLQCHYLHRNERQRVSEVTAYLQEIDRHEAGPHVLLGDFNALAPGDRFETDGLPFKERLMLWWERGRTYHEAIASVLARGYTDCFRSLHPDEPGFTLPVQAPHVRLDYIFADPMLARGLKECCVVVNDATRRASDHFPVMAEFEL